MCTVLRVLKRRACRVSSLDDDEKTVSVHRYGCGYSILETKRNTTRRLLIDRMCRMPGRMPPPTALHSAAQVGAACSTANATKSVLPVVA